MAITVFQRSKNDWLLVTGMLPTVAAYERHWTAQRKWSSLDMAMSFKSESEAAEYLEANRTAMDSAESN